MPRRDGKFFRRREAIKQVRRVLPASEGPTCRVLVKRRLTGGIIVLGGDYGRYGYPRIYALLGHASWQVSVSAVERIWRQEGLTTSSRIRPDYGPEFIKHAAREWLGWPEATVPTNFGSCHNFAESALMSVRRSTRLRAKPIPSGPAMYRASQTG